MKIIANNYASQAQGDLNKLIKAPFFQDNPSDTQFIRHLVKQIDNAIHFQMPEGGKIFDDDLKGIKGNVIRLPFPLITFSFERDGTKFVCIAEEEKSVRAVEGTPIMFRLNIILSNAQSQGWTPGIIEAHASSAWDDGAEEGAHPGKVQIRSRLVFCVPSFINSSKNVSGPEFSTDQRAATICINSLLELCEALSCSNVKHEPIDKINKNMNLRRVKGGKLPLFEIRTLTIDSESISGQSESFGSNFDRSKVRQHLRRGHIRRLPKGNIWINSMTVGSSDSGLITKTYQVK